jgi:hypothetical protein
MSNFSKAPKGWRYGMKVWVVAEHRFEWFEIKHICDSEKTALARWKELRDELIKDNREMVKHCKKELQDAAEYKNNITMLKNLKPGELCKCDCPDIKGWRVEP